LIQMFRLYASLSDFFRSLAYETDPATIIEIVVVAVSIQSDQCNVTKKEMKILGWDQH
jgi:hypothetical protein